VKKNNHRSYPVTRQNNYGSYFVTVVILTRYTGTSGASELTFCTLLQSTLCPVQYLVLYNRDVHCVSKKGPTLKRYSLKLYGSILMLFGGNIQKSLE